MQPLRLSVLLLFLANSMPSARAGEYYGFNFSLAEYGSLDPGTRSAAPNLIEKVLLSPEGLAFWDPESRMTGGYMANNGTIGDQMIRHVKFFLNPRSIDSDWAYGPITSPSDLRRFVKKNMPSAGYHGFLQLRDSYARRAPDLQACETRAQAIVREAARRLEAEEQARREEEAARKKARLEQEEARRAQLERERAERAAAQATLEAKRRAEITERLASSRQCTVQAAARMAERFLASSGCEPMEIEVGELDEEKGAWGFLGTAKCFAPYVHAKRFLIHVFPTDASCNSWRELNLDMWKL